jgi:hypothetical protein
LFLLGIALAGTWGGKPGSAPALAGAWLFLAAAVALIVSAPVAAWRWSKAKHAARATMASVAMLRQAAGPQPDDAIQPDDVQPDDAIQPRNAIGPDDAETFGPGLRPGRGAGGHGHPEPHEPPDPPCPDGQRPELV